MPAATTAAHRHGRTGHSCREKAARAKRFWPVSESSDKDHRCPGQLAHLSSSTGGAVAAANAQEPRAATRGGPRAEHCTDAQSIPVRVTRDRRVSSEIRIHSSRILSSPDPPLTSAAVCCCMYAVRP